MSEQDLLKLKEEIKQEIIAETNAKKESQNAWNKIKEEYKDEFSKFDFIEHWEYTDADNRVISRDTQVSAQYPLQSAIGTLLRIIYKSKTVAKMNIDYENAKDTVERILNILKEKAGIDNEKLEVK